MAKKREKEDKLGLLAKALKEEAQSSEGLKDHFIRRISGIVASERNNKAPIYLFLTSRPALAAVMASAAIILIVCLPLFLQFNQEKEIFNDSVTMLEKSKKPLFYGKSETFEPLKINAKKTDGTVELSWEGSKKNVYKIVRSTSPKDFTNAYTVMVAGNSWTDPLKNDSNIIYYKIE